MKICKGVSASPGLVLGQVSRLERHVETFSTGPFDPERELRQLEDAVRTAQSELDFWVQALTEGDVTPAVLGQSFIFTTDKANSYTDAQAFYTMASYALLEALTRETAVKDLGEYLASGKEPQPVKQETKKPEAKPQAKKEAPKPEAAKPQPKQPEAPKAEPKAEQAKPAQNAQHDIAHGGSFAAHNAAGDVTSQSADQQTENKTKHNILPPEF